MQNLGWRLRYQIILRLLGDINVGGPCSMGRVWGKILNCCLAVLKLAEGSRIGKEGRIAKGIAVLSLDASKSSNDTLKAHLVANNNKITWESIYMRYKF